MKCKYRMRCFSSKGAYLVLLWTMITFTVLSTNHSLMLMNKSLQSILQWKWLVLILGVVGLVFAPLSGWLADMKFGNYNIFKFGILSVFIFSAINCLFLILEALFWEGNLIFTWICGSLTSIFWLLGTFMCFATSLPLGLDQMPDGSASSYSSYIAWFVCTVFVGGLICEGLIALMQNWIDENILLNFQIILALVSTIFTSVLFMCVFFLCKKWLIIEPRSSKSLRTIGLVLKFAAKHKTPLNRSAFTYWEENIPSRIDLGKSKYGGPFTTEQVEDVKTVLRLLVISLAFFLISFSLFYFVNIPPHSSYKYVINFIVESSFVYSFLSTLTYEFLIYPLFRNRLPSILRRIGAVCLIMIIFSFVCFVLKLVNFLSHSNHHSVTEYTIHILQYIAIGVLGQVLLISVLEFMCAQSPYNMRGLLISSVGSLIAISSAFGYYAENFLIRVHCTELWCSVVSMAVKVVLCLIAFLLFCVVARWYKTRVRDEDYSTQRAVEEVYDRYLTAAAHSPGYGTNN